MTDSDEILILPTEVDDADEEIFVDVSEAHGLPLWPFILLGGALLGFAAAFAASWYVQPAAYDPAPLRAEMADLQRELAELRDRPAPVIPKVDLAPINRRIQLLEARPTVEPLSAEIVTRMEALQAQGFELPEVPPEMAHLSMLEDRVTALETRLEDQNQRILDLPELAIAEAVTPSEPYTDPASLPRFPAKVLREGAEQLSGSGLLRRTFSRHVRVRGNEDPELLIDGIERDLAEGQPRAALKKFDQLPSRLRSLARGWRADMEDAVQ